MDKRKFLALTTSMADMAMRPQFVARAMMLRATCTELAAWATERLRVRAIPYQATDAVLMIPPLQDHLEELNAAGNPRITDTAVRHLAALQTLNASGNLGITDAAVQHLSLLQTLNASGNPRITDAAVFTVDDTGTVVDHLPALTSLDATRLVGGDDGISDAGILRLPNLEHLWAEEHSPISDASVSTLARLKTLYVTNNPAVTDLALASTPLIERLGARNAGGITDAGVVALPRLVALDASNNPSITDESIRTLVGLTELDASDTDTISDASVRHLTALTTLDATDNELIGNFALPGELTMLQVLPRLTTLQAGGGCGISDVSLRFAVGLTMLDASSNGFISADSVRHLTALTTLDVSNNMSIGDARLGFGPPLLGVLPRLTTLRARGLSAITDASLVYATGLTALDVSRHREITNRGVAALTRLVSLRAAGARRVTAAVRGALPLLARFEG